VASSAKFYIFKAALDAHLIALSIMGLLTSAVAAYYYLRLVVVMYMQPAPIDAAELPPPSAGIRVALLISCAATILLGVVPSLVLDIAGPRRRLHPLSRIPQKTGD